jgi:hypothetical protein
MTTNSNPATGCIDTADGGNDHQLQLWIERNEGGFVFVVRQQHLPGGKLGRRCTLDSGSTNANYDEVAAAGRVAFDKAKVPARAA